MPKMISMVAARIGIIGLPNVGKSTLFNALQASVTAATAPYPFTTIDPNISMVDVTDLRLAVLASAYGTRTILPATYELLDIAGLVEGASSGAGLGGQFLHVMRSCDILVLVLRAGGNGETPTPAVQLETIRNELCSADIAVLSHACEKFLRRAAGGHPASITSRDDLRLLMERLRTGVWLDGEGAPSLLSHLNLLTSKPRIVICNDFDTGAHSQSGLLDADVALNAQIESELCALAPTPEHDWRAEFGLGSLAAADAISRKVYERLQLISVYGASRQALKVWALRQGSRAVEVGSLIHSDFSERVVRVEVLRADDVIQLGSDSRARELGLVRLESPHYIVQDGDILYFRLRQ